MYLRQRKPFRIYKMHTCRIYILIGPDGPFYIGRTKRPMRFRMNEHKHFLGFMPKYRVIATCSENCREVERLWIEKYRDAGYQLMNVYCGSQGSHFIPDSVREKMSFAHRGRRITWADKISAAQKGRPKRWSVEGRKRVQASQFKPGHNGMPEASRRGGLAAWAGKSKLERLQPVLHLNELLRRDPAIREKQRQGIIRSWKRRRSAWAA